LNIRRNIHNGTKVYGCCKRELRRKTFSTIMPFPECLHLVILAFQEYLFVVETPNIFILNIGTFLPNTPHHVTEDRNLHDHYKSYISLSVYSNFVACNQ
jgi:hypothetical protein